MPTGPVATATRSTPVGSGASSSRIALRLPAFGGSKVTVTLRVAPTARLTPSRVLQFALKSPTVAKARPLILQAGDGNTTVAVPVLRTTSVLVMGNAVVAT